MEATCATCFFFKESGNVDVPGYCRRYPPQLTSITKGDASDIYTFYESEFPNTHPDDWCGEHKFRT